MKLDKDLAFVNELIASLSRVSGVQAIVLGGSRAKGTHHSGSDFDLGLYYDSGSPPDTNDLCQAVRIIDDRKQDGLLTPFGEWGPWINGGGWLKIKSMPVDILYRDLAAVRSVFEDCLNGQISIAYQPGHPHGFVNSIYFAELAQCQVLHDSKGIISELKSRTLPYPIVLKKGIVHKFLWETEFSLVGAKKGIPYQDISYVAGSFFRTVSCLTQVVYALNEQYWMNEKGAVKAASAFALCPAKFEKRINDAFSKLWPDSEQLSHGIKVLSDLASETTALVKEQGI